MLSVWAVLLLAFKRLTLKQLQIVQLLLTLVIAPPLLAAFVYILLHSGPYMALYLWGFVFAVSMLFMTLYPSLIAPLFNKFDPLPEGALR